MHYKLLIVLCLSYLVNSNWVDWDGRALKTGDKIRFQVQYDKNYYPPKQIAPAYLSISTNWYYWTQYVIAGTSSDSQVNDFQLTSDATYITYTGASAAGVPTYNLAGWQVTISPVTQNSLNVFPLPGVAGVYEAGSGACSNFILSNSSYGFTMTLAPPYIWLIKPAPGGSNPYPSGCETGLDLMQCDQPVGHFGWHDYSMNLACKYRLLIQGTGTGTGTGCTEKTAVDYYGNDIISVSGSPSSSDCAQQCLSNQACVCYVWQTSNNCYLKRTCTGTGTSNPSNTAGFCPRTTTPSCIDKPNTDWGGNDIISLTRPSSSECGKACLATKGCQCYAWDSSGSQTCWLKSLCWGTGTPTTNRQSGFCPQTIPACASRPNTDWGGNDITQIYTPDEASCGVSCLNTVGCTCYAWDSSGSQSCWLKTICSGGGTYNTNRQSGFCTEATDLLCTAQQNNDWSGNDITTVFTPNPTQCAAACQQDPACTCYAWDSTGSNTCWKKTICSGTGNVAYNRQSGFCPKVVQTISYCSSKPNTDWSGNDITTLITATQLDCSIACQANSACNCYGWDSSGTNTCWLKTICSGPGSATNYRQSGLCPKAYPSSCAPQPGLLWSGNDITSFTTASQLDCSLACQANSACQCYAWDSSGGNTCWLKTICSGTGTVAYNRQSGFCPKAFPTYCTAQPGLLWPGNDITQIQSPSVGHCSQQCQNTQNCLCFAYYPANSNCLLKSSCSGSGTISSDVQSGFCPK